MTEVGGRERPGAERLVLTADDVRMTVSATDGGRISSLIVADHELLVTEADGPIDWGCFPMVPFAGRIRDGRFSYAGRAVQLPRNLPPNAIHGTAFVRPWTIVAGDTLETDLGPDWPFAGRVRQRFTLDPGGLSIELALAADEPMPAALGWHPWFRRVLSGSRDDPRPSSPPADLAFEADSMWARDADGLPTGALVPPGPRPWDDCFSGVRSAPRLTWPGVLALEVRSTCELWVVYDGRVDAICIEPQTAPPDFPTIAPVTVEPGAELRATMELRWWAVSTRTAS